MSQDVPNPSVADLPDGVGDLVAELARERDVPEEELLSRLLGDGVEGPDAEEMRERLDALESELDELEGRIDELDDDLVEKVSDVRDRVIQVKREADAKADADHSHPDLVSDVEDAVSEANALRGEFGDLEDRVEGSLEEVTGEMASLREDMTELSEDARHKLNVLGAAVVEMRDQVRSLLAEREKRALVEEIKKDANRNGVTAAKCEACSETVRPGLLTEPRCTHCNETFEELDPKDGFFGSNVLRTGRPPELEGEIGPTASDLGDIVEE